MIKVGESGAAAPELPDPRRRVKAGGASGPAAPAKAGKAAEAAPAFSKALLDATEARSARALEAVLEELTRQGERLAASQNFDELDKYKSLVREFLDKAARGMTRLQLTDGGSGGRSAKVHVLLKKVDLQLEALTKDVLSRQGTPLSILARLDQIRGLLLDLYK